MTVLRIGSSGGDVNRLQQRLTELGLYSGPADGIFSTDVDSAVKTFQQNSGLGADGIVGPQTWAALFPANPAADDVAKRCLALTGSFETSKGAPECFSGLAGNFDGQGLSFGALQWNIGQGTLQPMLSEMSANHGDVFAGVFGDGTDELNEILGKSKAGQLQWCQTIQDRTGRSVGDPWKSRFFALGQTAEFQAIQLAQAEKYLQSAVAWCDRFGVTTERARALMFDISVQNGTISSGVESIIRGDFAAIPADAAPMDAEVARLRSIANRRAEASNPKFVEDVRTRKLTIANGQGTVHGVAYHLETQFGIRLQPVEG